MNQTEANIRLEKGDNPKEILKQCDDGVELDGYIKIDGKIIEIQR